jgi:TonB family protein
MSTMPSAPAYFGRYQVLEELGKGAMGVVYLCVDPRLSRPVAIKLLRESPHMTPQERETFHARFRNEVEAAGRMNHPGIVQIYDIGPLFIVMEFLEGKSLASLMRGGPTLTVRNVCSLVMRVADALDYAHRQGIVHRDIKPANIMLLDDGGVKVLDFGVARLDSSTLTQVGTVVGSVRYMAPEQMMGGAIDGRVDVFSLAAVAYELLTTQPPFPGKTITEVVGQVVHGAYVPARRIDSRLPEAVDAVFARSFVVRPAERYLRAMDFGSDLYEAVQDILEMGVVHPVQPGAVPPSVPTTVVLGTRPEAPSPVRPPTTILPVAEPIDGKREGVLLLESDPPGAEVSIDGHPAGRTPLPPLEVAFGRHLVRMEAEGREPVSAELELSREHPLKVLGFTLPPARSAGEPLHPGQFVPFGPGVVPPRRLGGELPVYPAAARERGMEGSPVVEIWIDEKGNVNDVAIVESAGGLLDGALLEAVTAWRFSPATVKGVPVSVRISLQHLFRR